MPSGTTVLIVGGGPVGLTAALILAKAGITVRIVESQRGIDTRMRASTFHPPTLDLLATLGIELPGRKVAVFQMRHHESGEYVKFDIGNIADATEHPYRLQLPQQHLCQRLLEELTTLGVSVEHLQTLTDVAQQTDSVRATLGDGSTVDADWLIGADGADSTVRRELGLTFAGRTYEHSSVLLSTHFQFQDYIDDLAGVSYCWSARGPYSLLHLEHLWRVSLYPGVDDLQRAAQTERVRDWLAFIHPATTNANIVDVSPYRVHERCADRFRVGRVLLAGDAAHVNPPSGGMGMNGGIHDAFNLCDKLQSVLQGADNDLLDRYDRQRRGVITRRIIPAATANRKRMAGTDVAQQLERLRKLQEVAADPVQRREYLLESSMINSLREADAIE